jgi:hypothetical protein
VAWYQIELGQASSMFYQNSNASNIGAKPSNFGTKALDAGRDSMLRFLRMNRRTQAVAVGVLSISSVALVLMLSHGTAIRNAVDKLNVQKGEYIADEATGVGSATGVHYYAEPPRDEGIYYHEQGPLLAKAGVDGRSKTDEIDPKLLTPDFVEPQYYSEVDNALENLFEPGGYASVTKTVRPMNTTAYIVMINRCPTLYSSAVSDLTDPGADIFEASAMIKQGVYANTDDSTKTERRHLRWNPLRALQESAETEPDRYTM